MKKYTLALLAVAALAQPSAAAPAISDGFEGAFPATGWSRQNLSTSLGSNPAWDQYTQDAISAHGGTKFVMADYNSVGPGGTISNWLITPEVPIVDGVTLRFWTLSTGAGIYPDRLDLRMSTAGASVDVGAAADTVGDFTSLLLQINPTLDATGYPTVWTEYVVTVTGVPVATTGRFAFRYFVTNSGPGGANGAAVVLDDVVVSSPCGDGIVIAGEACDDGNVVDGDGCDSNCTVTACGNGVVAGTEACDDGNVIDGDSCDANCTATACGNGVVTSGEACDDGNSNDSDACASDCTVVLVEQCGDGVLGGDEECDDDNRASGDGCDFDCVQEAGWTCELSEAFPSICRTSPSGGGGGGCDAGAVREGRGARGGILVMLGLVGLDALRRRRARRSAAERTGVASR